MASSCSSNDKRNFQCVTVASVDVIKLPLRDILTHHIEPVDLYKKIRSCSRLTLRPEQQKICLIRPPDLPDYNRFDVTLLYTLIRNLCPLTCPTQGWGNAPRASDIQISDDIERLRLFRNNYYAHAVSAEISDHIFKDIWRDLRQAFNRIQSMYRLDYEKELERIEESKYTSSHMEQCMDILNAFANEPCITIKGDNGISYGDTAKFEADVKKVESSCWSITWRKRRGDVIKCIDTSMERFSGSTKKILVIKAVCKDDEGEYQAVLSLESNGPEYKSRNTIRLNVLGDPPKVKILVDSPVFFGSETTIKSEVISTPKPEKIEWQKSKNGTDFICIEKPIHFKSTDIFTTPFLMIPKTTFADKLYYRLLVRNAIEESHSNKLYLNVTGSLPNITTSLETNVKNRSVKLTANIYFYDDSPGIFETFWTKKDKKINPEESGKKLSEMRTHNPSLTIENVRPDDAGEYQLTAINDVGSSTSDVIILGIPSVFTKKIEEYNGGLRITVTIKSLPAPCHVQWSSKCKDDETFTQIDINTEEYRGTTISFPHPVLVVRQRDQLEKNCFQIEVTNFIGKTVQEISGNDNPAVLRNTDIVKNTVYKDLEASIRFIKLNNILANQFPPEKVENLKFLLTTSNKVKLQNSVLNATSAMDCLRILQDEKLFTPTDVIFMQFLCRETGCLELYEKCIEYAEKQEALCFFEKRSVNGYVDVQFHVQGDLSRYTKQYLQDVRKTVAAIADCKEEDILLKSIEHSESFLLSLSVKDVYILKLLALKEQDRLKLRELNIDFFIIHKETIHLEKAKDEQKPDSSKESDKETEEKMEIPVTVKKRGRPRKYPMTVTKPSDLEHLDKQEFENTEFKENPEKHPNIGKKRGRPRKQPGVGVREKRKVTRSSYDTKMAENLQISMQSLYMDKLSPELRTKLEYYIKTLEDQSKPVPNDDRQERYCKYITKFASHFGNERVILTGSTSKGLRLRAHKDEGDFDYLIISGITIPVDALEQREDLPCFVHIRTDKIKTSFSEGLTVEGKYLHNKVLKEFEVTKEGFPITSGLKPILTAPKISKGRHSKHLEVNLEAKPGTSQDFNTEILSAIDEEDDTVNLQLAVQSSNLSTNMKGLLCNLVSMLETAIHMDNNTSLLFQSIGGLIRSATSSESSMPPAKRTCRRESETDSDSQKVHRIQYLYKSSKDFIAAFPLEGKLPCIEKWKQQMKNRKNLHWPKPDTIDEIYNAEMYVVAKPAIVKPNPSKYFCLGFNQAEHILAENFSSDQRLCLLLIKSLQKGFLGPYSDILTTFHWNNAFYHKCGEMNPTLFDRHSKILVALGNVLTYMAECLEKGYLEHYFIESNLLAHIPQEKANEIAAKIREILDDPEKTLEVYFKKRHTTDHACLVSEKDLKRDKRSGNQMLLTGKIMKTLSEFQIASADDDSTLAIALLDTLCLVLQKETDFLGKWSVFKNSAGPSPPWDLLTGLIAEKIQERKRGQEDTISEVIDAFISFLRTVSDYIQQSGAEAGSRGHYI